MSKIRYLNNITYRHGEKLALVDGSKLKFEFWRMAEVFCKDEQFQQWVGEETGAAVDAGGAQAFIKAICDIECLDNLDRNKAAADRFIKQIHHPYTFWKEQQA